MTARLKAAPFQNLDANVGVCPQFALARARPASTKFLRAQGGDPRVLCLYVSWGPGIKGQGRMANDSPKEDVNGFLGHLPPWPRQALNNSVIGMEQAYRQRKGLPLITDADIEALKAGRPMLWESGDAGSAPAASAAAPASPAPAAATTDPAPRPATAATAVTSSAAASVARGGEPTRYVGTPAVGTSMAVAGAGLASVGPEDKEINQQRRRLVWSSVVAFLAAWFLAFFRFFLPRTLFEPATSFKIGYPEEYGLGVDTKWQQKYRIWVDRTPDRLFVIYARCTHLGCTPDWKASENKFKCPCHGSGYDDEGVNFEGPAPRPMDRAFVQLTPDGQIQVDTSRLFSWPKGQPSKFNDPGSYLPV